MRSKGGNNMDSSIDTSDRSEPNVGILNSHWLFRGKHFHLRTNAKGLSPARMQQLLARLQSAMSVESNDPAQESAAPHA
jgi:hypothetical protein